MSHWPLSVSPSQGKFMRDAHLIHDAVKGTDAIPDPLDEPTGGPLKMVMPKKRRTSSVSKAVIQRKPSISERSALLQSPGSTADDRSESSIIFRYAIPIYFTQLMESSFSLVTIVCVGHLGTIELAASTLATMTANVLGISFIIGFVGALDTLCPQAWTSNPKSMGLHCQRSACILALFLIPQFILFWNAESILLLIRQDPQVASLTGSFLKIASLGLPGFAGFEIIRRWLQSQNIMHAPTIVSAIAFPCNILLNYLLVWLPPPVGLGFHGAAWAMVIVFYLMFFVGAAYCYFFAPRDAWAGFDKRALDFRQWGENLKLGLASMTMIDKFLQMSEWWAWEVLSFAISYFGPAVLASQAVLGSLQFIAYQGALALSSAAAVRIGNLIGADEPKKASQSARAALFLGVINGLINTILLLVFRNHLGRIFSSDESVLQIVSSIMPIVAAYQIFDSVAGVAFGILRGAGRSHIAAIMTGTSYWVVGIPLSLCLAFLTPLRLSGLWLAVTLALALTSAFCSVYITRMDFSEESRKALARNEEDAQETEGTSHSRGA